MCCVNFNKSITVYSEPPVTWSPNLVNDRPICCGEISTGPFYLLVGGALADQKKKRHEKQKWRNSSLDRHFDYMKARIVLFSKKSYPLQNCRVSIDYCSCRNQWWPSIELSGKRQPSTDICPRECRQAFPQRLRLSDCQTMEDRNLAGSFRSVSSAPSKTEYFHFTN
jgi:hypothetical protein